MNKKVKLMIKNNNMNLKNIFKDKIQFNKSLWTKIYQIKKIKLYLKSQNLKYLIQKFKFKQI